MISIGVAAAGGAAAYFLYKKANPIGPALVVTAWDPTDVSTPATFTFGGVTGDSSSDDTFNNGNTIPLNGHNWAVQASSKGTVIAVMKDSALYKLVTLTGLGPVKYQ